MTHISFLKYPCVGSVTAVDAPPVVLDRAQGIGCCLNRWQLFVFAHDLLKRSNRVVSQPEGSAGAA